MCGVPSNIAEHPYGLLPDLLTWRLEQLDEVGHGTLLQNHTTVLMRPRTDISQRPGRFELCLWILKKLDKPHKVRNHPRVNDLLNRWVVLKRQNLPETLRRLQDLIWICATHKTQKMSHICKVVVCFEHFIELEPWLVGDDVDTALLVSRVFPFAPAQLLFFRIFLVLSGFMVKTCHELRVPISEDIRFITFHFLL
jgi:hypothetical protein